MKKIVIILAVFVCIFGLTSCKEKQLPLPSVTSGLRGDLGIDDNINEETIDKYLNREDSVYFDMRMLIDEANYEAIGGDSYLSGFIKGFEVVSFPYICNVDSLPIEVGQTYSGNTLFSISGDEYIANYEESLNIILDLFPKDKNIFLMCGGGGYAGMMKKLLVYLGYDANKIYNIGGYWYYQGKNKVEVKYEEDGNTKYNFDLVKYHEISFNGLTKIDHDDGKTIDEKIDVSKIVSVNGKDGLHDLENNVKTFALFVYLPTCSSCKEFFPIVNEFIDINNVKVYAINLDSIFKDTNSVTENVAYAPSMMIYEDGKVIAYLDSGSDEDYDFYKSSEKLNEWFNSYIDINKLEKLD